MIGAMYYYTGSIWTSIIAHFITNAVQVLAVSYGLIALNLHASSTLLLSVAGFFVVLVTLFRMKQMSRGYQHDDDTSYR